MEQYTEVHMTKLRRPNVTLILYSYFLVKLPVLQLEALNRTVFCQQRCSFTLICWWPWNWKFKECLSDTTFWTLPSLWKPQLSFCLYPHCPLPPLYCHGCISSKILRSPSQFFENPLSSLWPPWNTKQSNIRNVFVVILLSEKNPVDWIILN